MTDVELLNKKIDESGLKRGFIASKIGLTYAGLWQMLKSGAEFKPSQINILCDLLRIENPDERKQIFLI